MRRALSYCALSSLLAACASGAALDAGHGGGDSGHLDGGIMDAGPPCVPACSGSDICVGGHCYSPTADADGDGVPTATDCDDGNPAIGRLAERACSSACGPGVEQCMDGAWMPCSAPAACDCHDGDPPRMLACGMCGMQTQVCTGGRWTDSGGCAGEGECMAGMMGTGTTCGMCGSQVRVCGADCHWSAFTCEGEGTCVAGAMQMDSAACGSCGTMTRTRTCDPTCNWGAYTAFGGCAGAGVCTPGATRAGSCDVCSEQTCTGACTWGACALAAGNNCHVPGSGWQCCGAHGYQFCGTASSGCGMCRWCGCSVPAPASYGC